ncbi:MAG: DUF655 domain-containing protein [Nanoarchaeota archaeon]|nr:DUF655 domain-containing protein [Nanoarchaeota archaeon]MBU4242148.1 DUF655 domain-containing protein [Nanoarchaeota archaeon]MBU4351994.1 DUF655 domain-containing protein [Nanoarchaeota archaeon]MBU4455967.1 DUF655 domain-containing protein [Nanoarchaeota archaeon]MCG2720322.1 DUF655 domain-containing protein [Nanoarchaeota archaeon]
MEIKKEEKAIILDFLPNGYPFDNRPMYKKTPIAQALGINHFSLLELIPRKEYSLKAHEEVYIGEGKRENIHHIVGKLAVEKLTQTARMELEFVIKELVQKNKEKFVDFFNNSGSITTRMHQIELLPGIGKKHMWEIIEQRKEQPFKDFEDIKKRVKLLPDPEKAIIKRIIREINNEDKYKLFVK